MLEKIEIEGYEDRYPFELSGGQQRVALARALVMQPQLLLLDEPFSSLDPELRETMRSWVRMKLKDEGTTALFVTHDKEEAMIMGYQLAVMKDGMIQQVGDPLEIYQNPKNSKVAEFFSDGLVLNDQSFVPFHRLAIEPYMVKRNQEEGSSKQTGYAGVVTGKFMRHGQRFEQIEIPELGKKIVLPVPQNFHINDRVLVVINNGLAE
jgi:iron(III) transport system ATP-binding protein